MKEKLKLTPLEKSWILYDIGNSAFVLMVSTLIPIYFNSLASSAGVNEDLYLSYWGYAGSIATNDFHSSQRILPTVHGGFLLSLFYQVDELCNFVIIRALL